MERSDKYLTTRELVTLDTLIILKMTTDTSKGLGVIILQCYYCAGLVQKYLMGPYNSGLNLTSVSYRAEYKKSLFSLLMGIFVRKLVKRQRYILRMQYTKFRKQITFQKHGIPFLKWPLFRAGVIRAHQVILKG